MITEIWIQNIKKAYKQIKCKFDGKKSDSNQKWNNDKYMKNECKNPKDIVKFESCYM